MRDRLLPRGPSDLLIQLAVIAAAYWLWRHARGAVDGSMSASFAHARDLIDAERALGALIEPNLQSWAIDAGWPAEVARWGYANLHFKGSCLMLAIVYFGYRGSYGFVRNTVIAAMAISVIGYALYPTAPPRFLPELGLDPSVTGNNPLLLSPGDPLFNPFAAVPSMHVGLSVILAWSLAPPRPLGGAEGGSVRLSAPDDLRGGGEREPLLARRGPGPGSRRGSGRRRDAPRAPPPGLVVRPARSPGSIRGDRRSAGAGGRARLVCGSPR